MSRYLIGEGTPVVVTDAQESWRARKLWTLDYFKKHYSNEELIASDRAPLRLEDNPKMQTLRTTLGDYIDYMQQPYHRLSAHERECGVRTSNLRSHVPRAEHAGWLPTPSSALVVRRRARRAIYMRRVCCRRSGCAMPSAMAMRGLMLRRSAPFYGNSWSPFIEHEKMRGHISRPYFVPDSIPNSDESDDPNLQRLDRSFTKIFLGPAGTVTRLHNDTYHTHAWLSQIRGTKQFILYPPSQARTIHCGEGIGGEQGASQTWFDPLAPDYKSFPRARQATPYVAVCGPGDTILVPSDWFHYAVALTPSVTLMRNFMNDHNAGPFFEVWNANQARDRTQPQKPRPPVAVLPIPAPKLPPAKAGSLTASAAGASRPSLVGPAATDAAASDASAGAEALPPFVPSAHFDGPRPGYVFTTRDGRVGYYRDPMQQQQQQQQQQRAALGRRVGANGVYHVTIDHSRHVQRHRTDAARPHAVPAATMAAAEAPPQPAGSMRLAIEPLDEPCARRTGITWRWSAPRRVARCP